MNCPKCNQEISGDQINIQQDLAYCGKCKKAVRISDYIHNVDDDFDIKLAPVGAWVREEKKQLVIGAAMRSPFTFFMVLFMIVWTCGALGGIYGYQILTSKFDLIMTLFGIPFIIATVYFWILTIMSIWGKVELTIDKRGGTIFRGIGSVGRSKNFRWTEVSTIKQRNSYRRTVSTYGSSIMLEGKRNILFGMGLKYERLYYLLRAMKIILANVKLQKKLI